MTAIGRSLRRIRETNKPPAFLAIYVSDLTRRTISPLCTCFSVSLWVHIAMSLQLTFTHTHSYVKYIFNYRNICKHNSMYVQVCVCVWSIYSYFTLMYNFIYYFFMRIKFRVLWLENAYTMQSFIWYVSTLCIPHIYMYVSDITRYFCVSQFSFVHFERFTLYRTNSIFKRIIQKYTTVYYSFRKKNSMM